MTYFYEVVHVGQKNTILPSGESECHKHLCNSPALVSVLPAAAAFPYFTWPVAGPGKIMCLNESSSTGLPISTWSGKERQQRIHVFKRPSPNPVTREGRSVLGLPDWGCRGSLGLYLNSFIEVLSPTRNLGDCWLPGQSPALERGALEDVPDTRGHHCFPVGSWREKTISEECGYRINSQQIIHCFLNSQRPSFVSVFSRGILHISLVAE